MSLHIELATPHKLKVIGWGSEGIDELSEMAAVVPIAGRHPVLVISSEMKKMFADFGLTDYDIFMRTTEPFHYEGVQNLWRKIAGNKTPKGNENI